MQSTGPAQDYSSTWDLDDLDSEPQPSRIRGKKRKANGHGGQAAATLISKIAVCTQNRSTTSNSALHMVNGRPTFRSPGRIRSRRSSLRQRMKPFLPCPEPYLRVAQLVPQDTINLPLRNQHQRQQAQRTTSCAGPNHTNLNAHNGIGGYRVASGNVNRAQDKRSQVEERQGVVIASAIRMAAISGKTPILATAGISVSLSCHSHCKLPTPSPIAPATLTFLH
jgi:hypothetical protein